MMDWTDRHCRFFLRQFSPQVLLYTEMITAAALVHGNRQRLLQYSAEEQPLAVQLGGSDPEQLAAAARMAEDLGYLEVNLNCGCPSDRVHAGAFGACLMQSPALVADCVAAMKQSVKIPVTVKFRVGVIDREVVGDTTTALDAAQRFDARDLEALRGFAQAILAAGSDALIVHARKAVLGGLSPQENRTVPPLRFDVVKALKAQFAGVPVIVNGGVRTRSEAGAALMDFDGVMIGREAYHRPWLLAELAADLRPDAMPAFPRMASVFETMHDYAQRELAVGTRLHAITRHMLGLISGLPGAREYRQLMSVEVQRGLPAQEVFSRAMAIAARAE
jgi:tRNA-dihydrouridine synthase A